MQECRHSPHPWMGPETCSSGKRDLAARIPVASIHPPTLTVEAGSSPTVIPAKGAERPRSRDPLARPSSSAARFSRRHPSRSPALKISAAQPVPLHRHPGSRSAAQAIRDLLSSTAGLRVPAATVTNTPHDNHTRDTPNRAALHDFRPMGPGSPSLRSVGRDDALMDAPHKPLRPKTGPEPSSHRCCTAQKCMAAMTNRHFRCGRRLLIYVASHSR